MSSHASLQGMTAHPPLLDDQRPWRPVRALALSPDVLQDPQLSPRRPPPGGMKLPTPEPHLPLRKESVAQKIEDRRRSIPKPVFAPAPDAVPHPPQHLRESPHRHPQIHQVQGFSPSPVQPSQRVGNVQASSEHAFAAREPRRPFKPALGVSENQQSAVSRYADQSSPQFPPDGASHRFRPPSSPMTSPTLPRNDPSSPAKSLKQSVSVGDGLRNIRSRVSGKGRHGDKDGRLTPDTLYACTPPGFQPDEMRDSFRSALTSHSSFGHASSVLTTQTTHTSFSSNSEYIKGRRDDYEDGGGLTDLDMSVEDAIGMYEDGFESGTGSARPSPPPSLHLTRPSFEVRSIATKSSMDGGTGSIRSLDRASSLSKVHSALPERNLAAHRRSQSAGILIRASIRQPSRSPSRPSPVKENPTHDSVRCFASESHPTSPPPFISNLPPPAPVVDASIPIARDRYGFKKASHHVTVEQYDAWNAEYSEYLDRRSRKWHAMMHQFGYATDPAIRFPQKSEKVKRYVRKGIPPEFRGQAWFWYAGGPRLMAKEPTLYDELLERVASGELSDNDREHIERDLNRTFPDNIKFKPDPAAMQDAQAGAGGGGLKNPIPNGTGAPSKQARNRQTEDPETSIVESLRRVLQAFAVHNPQIGYCQSLNFIAGLLLLFLDGDVKQEHKAFILLNVVTSLHLPGTHGVALEGANIDIGVLMSCLKDSLPGIWAKLDDKKDLHAIASTGVGGGAGVGALRLPTVSLATTAWFMSLFVGTLPIESVLRVWDCLFFEGSKTLFRVALAIFKAGEAEISKVSDPMEVFQVVQTAPKSMLDCNALLEVCFRRRGGFAGVSQGLVERRREERRRMVKGVGKTHSGWSHDAALSAAAAAAATDNGGGEANTFRRMRTKLRTRAGTGR